MKRNNKRLRFLYFCLPFLFFSFFFCRFLTAQSVLFASQFNSLSIFFEMLTQIIVPFLIMITMIMIIMIRWTGVGRFSNRFIRDSIRMGAALNVKTCKIFQWSLFWNWWNCECGPVIWLRASFAQFPHFSCRIPFHWETEWSVPSFCLSLSLSLSLFFISLLLRSAFIFRILSAAHSIRSDRRIRLHSRFGIPANIIEPNPIRVTIIYGEMTIGINNQGKSKRLSPIEYERRGTRGTCKFQSDRSGKKSHAAPS